jgi:hypothetical protein
MSIGGTASRKITGQEIMNASKLNVGSTPIVSGTVGRLLFQGTGNVLQQSSSLFWDGTNNRLGIGTSTPTSAMQILGSTNVEGLLNITNNTTLNFANAVNILFPNTINGNQVAGFYIGKALSSKNGWGVSYTHSSDGSNSNRGSIDFFGVNSILNWFASGNVAINTTTDAGFRLDVNGTARATSYTLGNFIINQASANLFTISNPSGPSGRLDLYGGNTSQANIQIFGSSGGNTNNISFNLGVTNRAVIFGSTGNFAINTTADDGFKLDVNGTARVNGSSFFATTSGTLVSGTTTIVNMNYGEVPKTYLTGGTFMNGTVQFPTTLRVIATGGGIQFAQQSAPSPNSNIFFGNDSSGVYYGNYGSLPLKFMTSAVTQMTIFGTGNVGINTTTDAGFRLDVNGTARVQSNLTIGAGVSGTAYNISIISSLPSTGTRGSIQWNGGGTQIISKRTFAGGNNNVLSFVAGVELITLQDYASGGGYAPNVGINNTNPNQCAVLDVASTTQGFLPPRMTNAQRTAIVSPAVGLIVYCTDVTEGLWVYKSTGWTFIV